MVYTAWNNSGESMFVWVPSNRTTTSVVRNVTGWDRSELHYEKVLTPKRCEVIEAKQNTREIYRS